MHPLVRRIRAGGTTKIVIHSGTAGNIFTASSGRQATRAKPKFDRHAVRALTLQTIEYRWNTERTLAARSTNIDGTHIEHSQRVLHDPANDRVSASGELDCDLMIGVIARSRSTPGLVAFHFWVAALPSAHGHRVHSAIV